MQCGRKAPPGSEEACGQGRDVADTQALERPDSVTDTAAVHSTEPAQESAHCSKPPVDSVAPPADIFLVSSRDMRAHFTTTLHRPLPFDVEDLGGGGYVDVPVRMHRGGGSPAARTRSSSHDSKRGTDAAKSYAAEHAGDSGGWKLSATAAEAEAAPGGKLMPDGTAELTTEAIHVGHASLLHGERSEGELSDGEIRDDASPHVPAACAGPSRADPGQAPAQGYTRRVVTREDLEPRASDYRPKTSIAELPCYLTDMTMAVAGADHLSPAPREPEGALYLLSRSACPALTPAASACRYAQAPLQLPHCESP